jgi:periplasmic protein TonB
MQPEAYRRARPPATLRPPMPAAPPTAVVHPRAGAHAVLAALVSLLLHLVLFAALAWNGSASDAQGGRPLLIALAPASRVATTPRTRPAAPASAPAAAAGPSRAEPVESARTAAAARPSQIATVSARTARPSPVPAGPAPAHSAVAPRAAENAARVWGATGRAAFEWQVERWLAQHRHYPRAAVRAGYEGSPRLRFVLAPDGTLRHAELIGSSGYALLDRAALQLVREAAPFPPLPGEAGLDEIELMLPIDYRLRPSGRE